MIPCMFFVWIPPFIFFIIIAVDIIFMLVEEVGRRGWKVCVPVHNAQFGFQGVSQCQRADSVKGG